MAAQHTARVSSPADAACLTGLRLPPRSPVPATTSTTRRMSDCTGCLSGDLLHDRPAIIALPGAWAMGDGLILEDAHLPPLPAAGRRRRAASVASYVSSGGEGLGESLFRMAGSFTASVNEYFADLANWAVEEGDEHGPGDEMTVSGGSFFDGGQLLFPPTSAASSSSSASASASARRARSAGGGSACGSTGGGLPSKKLD